MISQRDTRDQHGLAVKHTWHGLAVKHTCSTDKTDRLKRKWRFGGQKSKTETEGIGQRKSKLDLNHCGLFYFPSQLLRAVVCPESITAGCSISRVNHCGLFSFPTMTGLMYVPSTRTNILLRDCSHVALTKPLKMYAV